MASSLLSLSALASILSSPRLLRAPTGTPRVLLMSAEPVDAATAKEMVDSGAQVLDVRIDGEARLDGIIAGAEVLPSHTWEHGFFLPRDEFVNEAAAQFSKSAPLLVCCADGMRSMSACTQLADAGFESVSYLDGGTRAWLAEEYDLVLSDDEGEEDDYRWT